MKYILYLCLITINMLFANTQKINEPKTPVAQMPKNPTMPQIEMPKNPTQNNSETNESKTTILQNLINDAIGRNMLLNAACIPEKIALQSKLNTQEVRQLGVQLQLTTAQYKDNLLRLQSLMLKPAQSEAQKQFITINKGELTGVLIAIEFLDKGIKKHSIALAPNYLQIDNVLLENTPQIFRIFQTYFCHANTIQSQ